MKSVVLVLLVLAVAGCAANANYDLIHSAQYHSVTDGDTFKVDVPGWHPAVGHELPIRVRGVDTPEIHGECEFEKQLAQQARGFTELKIMLAKRMVLRDIERDGFFRLVADVDLDGEDLATALIHAGLGRAYDGKSKRRGWCE